MTEQEYSEMSENCKIKVIPNGPIRIEGSDATIEMPDGSTVTRDAPFSLCRCGQSANKPFCDGTHTRCGFKD